VVAAASTNPRNRFSLTDLIYRTKRTNTNSILLCNVVSQWWKRGQETVSVSPFFRRHEDPLNQEPLEDLRPDALEQPQGALPFHNKVHNLAEALERPSLSFSRWPRLQPDLGNN